MGGLLYSKSELIQTGNKEWGMKVTEQLSSVPRAELRWVHIVTGWIRANGKKTFFFSDCPTLEH